VILSPLVNGYGSFPSRNLLEGMMCEVFVLAHARGVHVADEAVEKTLTAIDLLPEQATASMQRDIMAGRPSELKSQIGVVVRMAHQAGVEVPHHTFLYASLLPQERKARGEIGFSTLRHSFQLPHFPGTLEAREPC
jgi:2-dehydropantoate 2-reductase